MKQFQIIVASSIIAWASAAHGQDVNLTVNADKVMRQIDDKIYGHFLEHIYHSCNGGLWGDIIWNRSFEELPPIKKDAPKSDVPTKPAFARHWQIIGDGNVSLDKEQPFNDKTSVKIVSNVGGTGVAQQHFCLRKGDVCRGSLWLRGEAPEGIVVRFIDNDKKLAEQMLPAPTGEWQEYPLELKPTTAADVATLQIVARGKAAIWLDQVSLMPDSFRAAGGFRPDLLQAIADLRPATIRWPGGSFIGNYNWNNGIGPQSKRIGKKGWDEFDPLSFGLDEFMALCKKVGAEPVVVVHIGPRNKPDQWPKYVQEALDELEYCNGPADSTWGKTRAANGHPEPYDVKYWEIDNELWMSKMPVPAYLDAVKLFSDALRKKDPSIKIMACGGRGTNNNGDDQWNLKMLAGDVNTYDYLSIHHYEGAGNYAKGVQNFEKHFAGLRELIAKSANPNLKLYLSEWNAQSTDWRTGLYAGGLLNVMERNSDIIPMACPALWLRHVTAPSWDNAFINFDNRTWFPAPNYVVMKLYRDNFAPNLLELSGEPGELNAVATKSADGKHIFIKAVNPTDKAIDMRFEITGGFVASKADLKLVAPDDLKARNTLDQRDAVCAIDGRTQLEGKTIKFSLPRRSVGVASLTKAETSSPPSAN